MSPAGESADDGLTYRDRDSVLLPDGSALAMTDAVARLEWQAMLCPTMPHSYVVNTWSSLDNAAFDAILAMIDHSPDTVLAYWRGYQWPTRYWHGPNGFRYWTTPGFAPGSNVLNRTDDVDDTRSVERGGQPIPDWVGCPWEPHESDPRIYERVDGLDGWWPTEAALAGGYQPCKACQRRTADSVLAGEAVPNGLNQPQAAG